MSEGLVSILVPCHNAEPWLSATLESALAQTWLEREIILVDDGSTDGSAEIARSFASRGVRVFCQTNRGASAARNRALAEAKGDFIQYLDADDLLAPFKLQAQMEMLRHRAPGVVASGRWCRFEGDPSRRRVVDSPIFRDLSAMEFLLLAASEGHMMHPAAWLTPRHVAAAAGSWNESLSLNDDGEYFARVLLASNGIAFCDQAESFYRSNLAASLSGRKDERAKRSLLRSADLIADHMVHTADSPLVQNAIASLYLRVLHSIYPAPRDLIDRAVERIAHFGGHVTSPPMGPKAAILSRLIGWKLVYQLRSTISKLLQARSE